MKRVAHILADTGLGKEFEQLELSKCAETEHGMIKRRDFLDCHFATGGPVDSGADDAVCTFSNDIEDLVLCSWLSISDS